MDKVIETLLGQGASGLMVIGLSYIAIRLYDRNQKLTDTLIEIGKESVRANEAATAALNRMSDLLRGRRE